jgi:hypothetical protein
MQSKPNRGMNNSSTPRRDPISSIDAMFPCEMGVRVQRAFCTARTRVHPSPRHHATRANARDQVGLRGKSFPQKLAPAAC